MALAPLEIQRTAAPLRAQVLERVRADASGAPRPGSRQGKADSVPGE